VRWSRFLVGHDCMPPILFLLVWIRRTGGLREHNQLALSYNCLMEVLVYSATWCPDCRTAKRFLEKHNICYKEINIESTPGAAEEVIRQTGKRAVPQFVIDGRWVQPYRPGEGFLYEEMSALLHLVDEG